jgi:hypothetical protein
MEVRDPSLPYWRRVVAFRRCVSSYCPLGYEATLSFLEMRAGPSGHDEAALLRALEMLEASRALWREDVLRYTAMRKEAKRRGRRTPPLHQANPSGAAFWYGDSQPAALHAVRFWRRSRSAVFARRADPVVLELLSCVVASSESGGQLTPAQWQLVAGCVAELEQRMAYDLSRSDGVKYTSNRSLLNVARLLQDAIPAE